jgi:hypothetical protein
MAFVVVRDFRQRWPVYVRESSSEVVMFIWLIMVLDDAPSRRVLESADLWHTLAAYRGQLIITRYLDKTWRHSEGDDQA